MNSAPPYEQIYEQADRRVLFAQDAEASVLGAMLMETDAIDRAVELLEAECFYLEPHRVLFKAIVNLRESGRPADPENLLDQLQKKGKLEEIGGMQFIYEIAGSVPTPKNIDSHAQIVKEKYWLRTIRAHCEWGLQKTAGSVEDVSALRDELEGRFLAVGQESSNGMQRIGDYVSGYMDELEKRAKNGGGITGIRTGFIDLDHLLCGLQPGDLCIVGGYTTHGKTAFSLQVALNATRILPQYSQQVPVVFFSLEMDTQQQLMDRITANLSQVEMQLLKRAELTDSEWNRVSIAANEIYGLPLFIEDCAGISLMELRARARRLKKKENAGLIVVDYLQLVRCKADSRREEVAAVARGLKNLAREIEVPVMALAQINRAAAHRANPAPTKHDLKESGEIEQAADQILFVYRPGQEGHTEMVDGHQAVISKQVTDILLEKNRNGATGRAEANFIGSTQLFTTSTARAER